MIDRHVILSVVWMVGGIAMVLVVGIVYSSITSKAVDNGLSTLAGTALGYLGGILTNVARARDPLAPQQVVTPPNQPLQVTESHAYEETVS
jgi:hypothetical protein